MWLSKSNGQGQSFLVHQTMPDSMTNASSAVHCILIILVCCVALFHIILMQIDLESLEKQKAKKEKDSKVLLYHATCMCMLPLVVTRLMHTHLGSTHHEEVEGIISWCHKSAFSLASHILVTITMIPSCQHHNHSTHTLSQTQIIARLSRSRIFESMAVKWSACWPNEHIYCSNTKDSNI